MLARFSLLAFCLFLAFPVAAQERANEEARSSPNALVGQTIGTTDVTVTYGRPHVRGREIFGGLEPYGEVWRTGANEATTITFSNDVSFGGEEVAAGTYALFTIPGEESWTVILNSEANQWGAMNHDASKDVARIEVTPQAATTAEMMTFYFDNVSDTEGMLVLHWAETRVPIMIGVGS